MANPSEMSLMCRLCLIKDDKQVNIPIFDDRGDIKQIFVKISACLPVEISKDDRLPKKICDRCSDKLDLYYEFRNTSQDSEKLLLSWLAKYDDQINSAVAQQITEPVIKEEIDIAEESSHLDVAQHSSIDEVDEDEEPPAKRPRRSAAIKAQISIAPESDEDDNMIDEPNNMIDEPDSDNDEDEIIDEPDTVDAEALTKIEDESDDETDVPGTSAYDDQPGPSGLGKDGAEEPMAVIRSLLKNPEVTQNAPPQVNSHLLTVRQKTKDGKVARKPCKRCYANGKRRDTIYVCTTCPNEPGYCLDCATIEHK